MKNECGKTRKVENPYEIWQSIDGTWEYRVLKKYQGPDKEKTNRYARWFCAVKSPFTYGSWEYGDTYVIDVISNARKVFPVGENIVYNVRIPNAVYEEVK